MLLLQTLSGWGSKQNRRHREQQKIKQKDTTEWKQRLTWHKGGEKDQTEEHIKMKGNADQDTKEHNRVLTQCKQ